MTVVLVLGMLVMLALVEVVLALRRRARPLRAPTLPEAMREPCPPFGLFVDGAHSWVRICGDGTLRVGIDDFLAEALGAVQAVELPAVGTHVARGEPLITLRLGERQLVIPSPASGEVRSTNDLVTSSPGTLTVDPYGLGWTVSLWTRDHKEAIHPLHVGNGAVAFLRQELQRFVDFLTTRNAVGRPLLADGGVPRRGAVADLDEAAWASFSRQFVEGERPASSEG